MTHTPTNGKKMKNPAALITGLILAGGQGRRMGGRDKGWVEWRGKPLVRHSLEALAPQVGGLLISANRNLEAYRALGWPVLSDTLPGFAGPLAGIAAALAVCQTPYLLVVPCDVPELPADLAARLWDALHTADQPIAAVRDGERLQPLLALWRRDLLPALSAYLQAGERKVQAFYAAQGYAVADFSGHLLANLNAPPTLQ
jgi:molybdenum cofactor guanylyltransferase